MSAVSVSELKANLSAFLDQVKAGQEVIVTERGHPIARIAPLTRSGASAAEHAAMIRAGVIRPARRRPTPDSLRAPRVADPEGYARRALEQERESGW